MENVDWQTTWAGAMTFLTFGLLLATWIYAWLTWRLVRASEAQSWEIARPRVLVSLQTTQGGQYMVLQIENLGLLPANDLKIEIDRPLFSQVAGKQDIREIPLFKHGLSSLFPRTRIRIGLGVAFNYLKEDVDRMKHPLAFEIRAHYSSPGKEIFDTFPIDVERQLLRTAVDRDYLDDFGREFPNMFAKHMREIASAIHHIQPRSRDAFED